MTTPATSDGGEWVEKLSVYRIACRGMEVDNISSVTQEHYKKKFKEELERAKKEAHKQTIAFISDYKDWQMVREDILLAELEAAINQEKEETT